MIGKFLLIAILLVAAQSQTDTMPSTCPSECKCYGNRAISCIACLQTYFRSYDVSSSLCPCLAGFVENHAVGDHCCPANCTTCTALGGCASCPRTWQLLLTKTGLGVCICRDNYFFDGSACRCLSVIQPSSYYEVVAENACYACPPGCLCNQNGCVMCSNSTLRSVISVVEGNGQVRASCPCRSPYRETYQLVCVCPEGCNCTAGATMSCLDNSNRFYSTKTLTWECVFPYQDSNGSCNCWKPYVLISSGTSNTTQCACGSRNGTGFVLYQINQQQECIPCPIDCVCNEIGCFWCNGPAQRYYHMYTCPCRPPYRQVMGTCQCYSPYANIQGDCQCMSLAFPTQYYSYSADNGTSYCVSCPADCTCNSSGCMTCSKSSLRILETVGDMSVCVRCVAFAKQVNKVCVCADGSTPSAQGSCGCDTAPLIFYQLNVQECRVCPYGCNCTSTRGCYSCEGFALRNVSRDAATNMSVCPCIDAARISDMDGACYCTHLVDTTRQYSCTCPSSYFLDPETGQCACMSAKQPSLYYRDLYTGQCRYCPLNCNCDVGGCVTCGANTQRYVYVDMNYSQCLCYQTVGLVNESCSKCQSHQFYANGHCIYCWECNECNDVGQCTSCGANMTLLSNGTCACNNPIFKNVNGTCVCPKTLYFFNNICNPCPAVCHYCDLLPDFGEPAQCVSCNVGVHRVNSAWFQCPCEVGYRQSPSGVKSYCCDQRCGDCNATGCVSCIADTYRVLDDKQDCVCMGNMIEQNSSLVCTCPFGYFPEDGTCELCPNYCSGCFFSQATLDVHCITCPENSNRRLNPDSNGIIYCYCMHNFQETQPDSWFCFPRHCEKEEVVCKSCLGNRVPINNGSSCVCKETFFEDGLGQCASCNMPGCLNCQSVHICVLCNESDSYFLAESSCKKLMNSSSYIYSQSYSGIYLEFQADFRLSNTSSMVFLNGYLMKIIPLFTNTSEPIPPVVLSTYEAFPTAQNLIYARLSHPAEEINDTILGVSYGFTEKIFPVVRASSYDSTGQGIFMNNESFIYLRIARVYSAAHMDFDARKEAKSAKVLTIIALILSFVLYVKGFKHNQTVFFLQTMSFLQFVIKDEQLGMTVLLFQLRYAYFSFGNLLSSLIPSDYLEESKGNFSYFSVDSNLIRTAGTPITIAFAVAILSFGFRLIVWGYICLKNRKRSKAREVIRSLKKDVYRVLEFFYKSCMYPVLYFSFVFLHEWKSRILSDHPSFMSFCFGVAVTACVAYTLVTMYQIWFENISQIHKIENTSEFVSIVTAGVILALTQFTQFYLAIVAVFILRGGIYLMLRKSILRDFKPIEHLKILTTMLEVVSILLTVGTNLTILVVFIILTVVVQLIHSSAVVLLGMRQAERQKRAPEEQIKQQVKCETEHQTVMEESVAYASTDKQSRSEVEDP